MVRNGATVCPKCKTTSDVFFGSYVGLQRALIEIIDCTAGSRTAQFEAFPCTVVVNEGRLARPWDEINRPAFLAQNSEAHGHTEMINDGGLREALENGVEHGLNCRRDNQAS
jgi:hypothetical protein